MSDPFQQLLDELGKILHLPLTVDTVNACSILIPPEFVVQLQLDSTQTHLILFSKIIPIPPGKFRENVLREALKTNNAPDPLPGILAYLASTNHLVLYQMYLLTILNGERLAGLLGSFVDCISAWHTAIGQGQNAPPSFTSARAAPNPFGF